MCHVKNAPRKELSSLSSDISFWLEILLIFISWWDKYGKDVQILALWLREPNCYFTYPSDY